MNKLKLKTDPAKLNQTILLQYFKSRYKTYTKCQSSILNNKKLNKMGVKKLNFVFNMQGGVIGEPQARFIED